MSACMVCPFCGYKTNTEYDILLHMEMLHAEGLSPFIADGLEGQDTAAAAPGGSEAGDVGPDLDYDEEQYAACPIDGCEEVVTLAELDDHIEFHAAEEHEAASDSYSQDALQTPPPGISGYRSPYMHTGDNTSYTTPDHHRPPGNDNGDSSETHHRHPHQAKAIEKWKSILKMPSSKSHTEHATTVPGPSNRQTPTRKRLGKAELGKYAHETKMPDWLVSHLEKGRYVCAEGIIPVIEQLLEQSPTTEYAYVCHPTVQHISKLRREGGFCGYRNIQMLSSYIVGANAPGNETFHGKIPSIFRIQEYIENAWDIGIHAQGRIETGGVKGTRKYIGTPEAQAMLLGLDIPVEAQGFKSPDPGVAEALLFSSIIKYFESGRHDPHDKVRRTSLPPIYFQHRGHSLTIIGLEKRQDGNMELLVFDPMFYDPAVVTRYIGRRFQHRNPDGALKLYRRGQKYLKKYHEFEILKLKS